MQRPKSPAVIACLSIPLIFGWASGTLMDVTKYAHRFLPLALLFGAILLFAFMWVVWQQPLERRRVPLFVFAVCWMAMCCFYAVIHPLSTQHTISQGNDSEDAIIKGWGNLLHGLYPYDAVTYLGKPITPMPGALFLAFPFALIHHVGFQNLLWLGMLILMSLSYFRSRFTALIFLLAILANAHTFVNILTGADYPTNCFYVVFAVFWFLRSETGWKQWASTLLLGLTLSSRPTYTIFLPPLLLAFLLQRDGWRSAFRRLLPALFVTVVVTLAFYLYAPSRFSPLHVTGFLVVVPLAWRQVAFVAIMGSAFLVSLSGFFVRLTVPRLFLLASIALAIVLFPPAMLWLAKYGITEAGTIILGYTDAAYILFCLWLFRYLEPSVDERVTSSALS